MSEVAISQSSVDPVWGCAARDGSTHQTFLNHVASDIRHLLGSDRIQRIALFGSRARGDARDIGGVDDSDWDVAVFVRGEPPSHEEQDQLTDWATDLMMASGRVVSPRVFEEDGWTRRTIFMLNLRQDMLDL